MPQIRQYSEQVNAQGGSTRTGIPEARAQESDFGGPGLANLGGAMIQTGQDFGRAARVQAEMDARDEVTAAYVKQADMFARTTVNLEKQSRTADPNDTGFVDRFTGALTDEMNKSDNFFTTFDGKQAWIRAKAEMSGHFLKQASHVYANLAGAAATQDFTKMVDSWQITVNNAPNMFGDVRTRMEHSIMDPKGLYARIPMEQRVGIIRQASNQIANAAMEGIIRNNPNVGRDLLENTKMPLGENGVNPAPFLTGEQLDALKTKAEVGIARQETAKERQRLAEERAKKETVEAQVQNFTRRILDPKNTGGMPSDEEIAASPMTGEKMAEVDAFKFRRIRELASQEEEKDHPVMVRKLLGQMITDGEDHAYSLDPVRAAYITGQISTKDLTFLQERFYRLKDNSTNTFERDLNHQVGITEQVLSNAIQFTGQPAAAIDAVGRMRADVYAAADRLRRDNKDPRALLDPSSKDYFFSPANISTYTRPPSQALREGVQAVLKQEAVKDSHSVLDEALQSVKSAVESVKSKLPDSVRSVFDETMQKVNKGLEELGKGTVPAAAEAKPKNVPQTALDAFASLKGVDRDKAMALYADMKKAHVKESGVSSAALADHLQDAYVRMGIRAAEARRLANESVEEIRKRVK